MSLQIIHVETHQGGITPVIVVGEAPTESTLRRIINHTDGNHVRKTDYNPGSMSSLESLAPHRLDEIRTLYSNPLCPLNAPIPSTPMNRSAGLIGETPYEALVPYHATRLGQNLPSIIFFG